MSKRLDRVEDFMEAAVECGFRLDRMATKLEVCERTLRRYIRDHFGLSGRGWRDEKRLELALGSLLRGEQVKKISSDTKFKYREGLSAFIKRQTGSPPRDFRRRE
jgi:AraC-like DNA-binding protein